MCSIGDEHFEEQEAKYLPAVEELSIEAICNKCHTQEACVVLRQKDAYCKDCFLAATTHKFKAFLGKHRFVYPGDKVLILFKEGQECAALLHFIRSGLDLNTPKKLRFQPMVLYIENNSALNIEERQSHFERVASNIQQFKFDCYFTSLVEFIKEDNVDVKFYGNYKDVPVNIEDGEILTKCLMKTKNQTHKLELIKLFERNILYQISKKLDCKHVFTPELGSHIAADLMSCVSVGRGLHLSLDIGILDNRDTDVNIIRPLRFFDIKEITYYNHFNNIDTINVATLSDMNGSVQQLMRNFIENLHANYPATINTIVRTGDKLSLKDGLQKNCQCKLCKGPIDNSSSELTAAESVKFSSLVSNHNMSGNADNTTAAYEKKLDLFRNVNSQEYCYACLRLKDVDITQYFL